MENFKNLGIPSSIEETLKRLNFNTPTDIQKKAIPFAIKGEDILGTAQTGTGKTFAFGIPLISKIISEPTSGAIVITPTRELATQVIKSLNTLITKEYGIKSALLIGGEAIQKQLKQLRTRPRIIVGTPGRINDHLKRKSLKLDHTNFLVLDETDRMLDMGFSIQIAEIIKFLPEKRQTLLFSATLPKNILNLAKSYLTNPKIIATENDRQPAKNINQEIVHTSGNDKYSQLLSQLDQREGSIIIFVKTKHGTEKIAKQLRKSNHSTDAIHGGLRHNKREKVITDFRKSKYRILVATDIAARGIDIPHIQHVINYDLPQCPEDYIHRIGRTARAGKKGNSLCLISPSDQIRWKAIERFINSGDSEPTNNKSKNRRNKPSNSSHKKRRFSGNKRARPALKKTAA